MNHFTPRAQQVLALARKEADGFHSEICVGMLKGAVLRQHIGDHEATIENILGAL